MSDARVIKATFSEWRMIKTRKVLQIVLEVPLEQQGDVLMRLGVPMPDREKMVAVALLDELVVSETERQQKAKDLSRSDAGKKRYANSDEMERAVTRAVLLAKDPQFQVWAGQGSEEGAAEFIRRSCGVESRRQIGSNDTALEFFRQLEEQFAEATGRLAERRA